MSNPKRRLWALSLGFFLALGGLAPPAVAQNFPNRPVRLIFPGAPGTSLDAFLRAMALQLESQMGQNVFVENLPGAGAVIGTSKLINSPPDGHTIALLTTTMVSHHLTTKKPHFRWPEDFVLAHQGVRYYYGLVIHANLPFKSVQDVVQYAKANPGKVKVGNPGVYTVGEIMSRLVQKEAGVQFLDVPYKSSAALHLALWTGEVDMSFVGVPGSTGPGIEAKTMRVLALTSKSRSTAFPGVATLAESGVGMVFESWLGFTLPKGTPAAIADRWYKEIAAALESPAIKKLIAEQKTALITSSREDMVRAISEEVNGMKVKLKEAGLEPE